MAATIAVAVAVVTSCTGVAATVLRRSLTPITAVLPKRGRGGCGLAADVRLVGLYRAVKAGESAFETGGMARGKARRWEGAKLGRFRKSNKGRNPTYNKTRSGGWKS